MSKTKAKKQKPVVSFTGIGAAKCGTSWLFEMLKVHPQVFLHPRKEINYFNKFPAESERVENLNYRKPLLWYENHFKGKKTFLCGDISPTYMWNKEVAKKIYHYNPEMKIIIMLRDPFKRTFSNYLYYVQRGIIPKKMSFGEAVTTYPLLVEMSMYSEQIKRYKQLFRNIHIIIFDDLVSSPEKVMASVETFLGIKKFKYPNLRQKKNKSRKPLFEPLSAFIHKIRLNLHKNKSKRTITFLRRTGLAGVAEFLRDGLLIDFNNYPSINRRKYPSLNKKFNQDLKKLEELTNLNLESWKYEAK